MLLLKRRTNERLIQSYITPVFHGLMFNWYFLSWYRLSDLGWQRLLTDSLLLLELFPNFMIYFWNCQENPSTTVPTFSSFHRIVFHQTRILHAIPVRRIAAPTDQSLRSSCTIDIVMLSPPPLFIHWRQEHKTTRSCTTLTIISPLYSIKNNVKEWVYHFFPWRIFQ